MNPKIFTHHEPDPVGLRLQTFFNRFDSRFGVGGLAKENGDRLDILAIHSEKQRCGQCRSFIAACKLEYRTICVWHVDNAILKAALTRWGFMPEVKIDMQQMLVDGMRWDK